MVSCARATRGLRRPSLDTRSGRPSSPPSRGKVGRTHYEKDWKGTHVGPVLPERAP